MKILVRTIQLLLATLPLFSCEGFPEFQRSLLETIGQLRFLQTNTTEYSLSVNVSGLEGKGLVLQNGNETKSISTNGKHTFGSRLLARSTYDVKVQSQPKGPDQICEVSAGTGTVIRGDIETIQVLCKEDPNRKFIVSGTIENLLGSGMQLKLNSSFSGATNEEVINIGGTSFAFSPLSLTSTYTITIASQPSNPSQTCNLMGSNTGTISGAVSLKISCITNSYMVKAQVVGIPITLGAGQELNLMINGVETIQANSNGNFSFATPVLSGTTYTVVVTNSGGYIVTGKCNIPVNSGVMGGIDATVIVNCSNGFTVQGGITNPGGTLSSVIGSGLQLTLQNTGGPTFVNQTISISPGQTSFAFPSPIPNGSSFQAVISTALAPPGIWQNCYLNSSSGTITGTDITNLSLECSLPAIGITSPIPGTYNNDLTTFNIINSVPGAEYYYTVGNGGQPDPTCGTGILGSVTPITVTNNANATIKIIQCRTGWLSSPIDVYSYNLQAGNLTLGLPSGSFYSLGQSFSITNVTSGSTWQCIKTDPVFVGDPICDTIGSTCLNGTAYFGSYTFSSGGTALNFKARNCKVGYNQSDVVSATYNPSGFYVSGTISGLTIPFGASSFVIRNNGTDELVISANGSFTFSSPINSGSNYNVTIFSNPSNPWQTCNVTNGSGTVSGSNVTNVSISCTLNTYSMSGTVTSSASLVSGLTISNGIESINVASGSTSTPISFPTQINSGTTYSISITAEPQGMVCQITSAFSDSVQNSNIINVGVNCVSGFRVPNNVLDRPPRPINISLYSGETVTQAGVGASGFVNGNGSTARFNQITGIAFDGQKGFLVDSANHAIRTFIPSTTAVETLVGNGVPGSSNGSGAISAFNSPYGIATDGTYLYVSEFLGNRIKRILISTGAAETWAGDDSVVSPPGGFVNATGTSARFSGPKGIALDGNNLYIADSGNNSIRVLNIHTREVTTLTSDPSFFDNPQGIIVIGNDIYSTSAGDSRDCIAVTNKISGSSSNFAGTVGVAGFRDGVGLGNSQFNNPNGIATDGENLYIADSGNNRLRRIQISSGRVITIAGSGNIGLNSDVGPKSNFTEPTSIINAGTTLVFSHSNAVSIVNFWQQSSHFPLAGNINSYSGNNALTPTGTLTFANGRFNEPNGAAVVGTTNGFNSARVVNGTNNFTMAAWFFWNGTDTASEKMLFYNGNPCSDGSGIILNANDNFIEVLRGGLGGTVMNQRLVPNTWVHLTLTVDNNYRHQVYYNGTLIGGVNFSSFSASNSFRLASTACGFNGMPGRVTEFRSFNRVLSGGEIQELAQNAMSSQVGSSFSSRSRDLLVQYNFWNSLDSETSVGGTLTGNIGTYAKGKEGIPNRAMRFNGVDQYLETNTKGIPMGQSPRTICSWVYPASYPSFGASFAIAGYGDPVIAQNYFALRMDNDSGTQKIHFGSGGTGLANFTYSLPLNSWSHVCGVFNGTQSQVFVNGFAVSTPVSVTGINTASGSNLTIANFNSGQFFEGKLTDFRIYNSALTSKQIRLIGAQNPFGLVARYDFNSDPDDVSGFGSNGTINGTVTLANDRYGKSSAYSFPATNGNSITASTTFLPTGNMNRTMCLWYRSIPTTFAVPISFGNPGASQAIFSVWLQQQTLLRSWGQGSDVNATIPIKDYIWRHVCITHNGVNTGQVYANGVLVATATQNLNISSGFNLGIGSHIGSREFGGQIDEVLIYNRLLSASEIQALAGYHPNQVSTYSTNVTSSGLKLHMQADSLSGQSNNSSVTAWEDQSGNERIFVPGNSPSFFTAGFQASGNNRPSVYFNSFSNHYLEIVGSTLGIPTNNSSFFVVFQRASNSGNLGIFEVNSAGGMSYFLNTNSLVKVRFDNTPIGFSSSAFGNVNFPYIASVFFTQNTSINFRSSGLDVSNNQSGIATGLGMNNFAMIGKTNVNSANFHGDIGELLYYNTNLGTSDSNLVHCYLSQKYGLRIPASAGFVCD